MDIHEFRSWVILILIITFASIVFWAYSRKRDKDFKDAANLPFNEPDQTEHQSRQRGDQ